MNRLPRDIGEVICDGFLSAVSNGLEQLDGRSKTPKTRHVRKSAKVVEKAIRELFASPENDKLYRPIKPEDVADLVESIRKHGIREPLIASADGYIISGHRRFAAAKLARLPEVPCIVLSIRRAADLDGFVRLLREHNRQRVKTRDEIFREELVSIDGTEAHAALVEARRTASKTNVSMMKIAGRKTRSRITAAKMPMLKAASTFIERNKSYWPLSDRQVHYGLLNDPPLRHASKPHSMYRNDAKSYGDLCDLLTRAPIRPLADGVSG